MLKHASIIITIITASLYTLGLNLHSGYLLELGIEETLFQLSFHRALFQGFVSTMQLGGPAVVWLLISSEIILFLVISGSFAVSWGFSKKWFNIPKLQLPNTLNNKSVNIGQLLFVSSCVLFIGYMFLLAVIMLSTKAGKDSAIRLKDNINNNLVTPHLITFKNKDQPITGYPVVCNSNQCAYISNDNTIVLNLSDIKNIKSSITNSSSASAKSAAP